MNRYVLSLSLLLTVPAGLLADNAEKRLDCLLRHQQEESKRQVDIEGMLKCIFGASVAAATARPVPNNATKCAHWMGNALNKMGELEVTGNHMPEVLKSQVHANVLGSEVCLWDEGMALQVCYAVVHALLAGGPDVEVKVVKAGVLAGLGEKVLGFLERILNGLCGGSVPVVGEKGDKYVRTFAREYCREVVCDALRKLPLLKD